MQDEEWRSLILSNLSHIRLKKPSYRNQLICSSTSWPGVYMIGTSDSCGILKTKDILSAYKSLKSLHFQSYKTDQKLDEVFENEQSKIYGRQPLKNLKWYGPPNYTRSIQTF